MNKKQVGVISAIASAVLFGTMPLATKIAFAYGENSYMASLGRFFWGSVSLLIMIQFTPNKKIILEKQKMIAILKMSLFYAATPVFLYLSYNYIGSGMATSLHFTYPITVVLILFFCYKEKIDKKQIGCLILCIAGIGMLYVSDGKTSTLGMTFALLSGIVYSVYIVLLRKSKLETVPLMTLSFWVSALATLELLIFTLIFGKFQMIFDVHVVGAEIYLGLFATAIAFVLFQKGTFICGAVQTSLLSTFESVTGVIIGMLVYGEILTTRKAIGILFIICSAMILVIPTKNKERRVIDK